MTGNESKKQKLFLALGSFFLANALIAEFIGVKIFSVEQTIGIDPLNLEIFGFSLPFNMTAGVLLWPVVFIMTDIINEYFGKKGVKLFSYIAAILIAYSFVVVYFSMSVSPADFWKEKKLDDNSLLNMDLAFNNVFGQGLWIIVGSLVAFLLGQLIDVFIFHVVKKKTGEKHIWLRANLSTAVSQLVDSFVVLFIAFYLSKLGTADQWSLQLVLAIGLVNYMYKLAVALILTPLLYLIHAIIDAFLGKELSEEMTKEAHGGYEVSR